MAELDPGAQQQLQMRNRFAPSLPSVTDIDVILESGREGLAFFHTLFAHYHAATGRYPGNCPAPNPSRTHTCMDDAYFMQSGMSLSGLEAFYREMDGEAIRRSAVMQDRILADLDRGWHGATADSVKADINALLRRASPDGDDIVQLAQAVSRVVDKIAECVRHKAVAFTELDGVRVINGIDMVGPRIEEPGNDVGIVIRCAQRREIDAAGRDRLAEIFFTASQLPIDRMQRVCAEWVVRFLSVAEGYADAYYGLCASTDTTIRRYLATVADLLSGTGRREARSREVEPVVGWFSDAGVVSATDRVPRIPKPNSAVEDAKPPTSAVGDAKTAAGATGAVLTESGPM